MKKTLFAFFLSAMVAVPAIALADLYVNPKDGLKTWEVAYGCHHWGSSVRCEGNSSYANFLLSDHATGCSVHATTQSAGSFKPLRWHVTVEPYHLYYPHKREVKCWYHWTNDNTVEIHAK